MLIVLEIVVVAAVIFAAAAYVVGLWDHGFEVYPPDAGSDGLPAGRLAPSMVDRARFGLAFRGYRMGEVDDVLDRLRDELADRDAELARLQGADPDPYADPYADVETDPAVDPAQEELPIAAADERPVDGRPVDGRPAGGPEVGESPSVASPHPYTPPDPDPR